MTFYDDISAANCKESVWMCCNFCVFFFFCIFWHLKFYFNIYVAICACCMSFHVSAVMLSYLPTLCHAKHNIRWYRIVLNCISFHRLYVCTMSMFVIKLFCLNKWKCLNWKIKRNYYWLIIIHCFFFVFVLISKKFFFHNFFLFLQKETPSDVLLHLAALRGDDITLHRVLDSGKVHVDCKDEVSAVLLINVYMQ